MTTHPPGPYWLDPNDPGTFPPVEWALEEPNGLLAVGGDLSSQRLLNAYAQGIFPWYSEGQPILWWSPNPRLVLLPNELHIPKSLRKTIKKTPYRITLDTAFAQVIEHCSTTPRDGQDGTWITDEMKQAYIQLHKQGYAHSVEAWQGEQLVGGLYGVALGKAFFGESMFALRPDASKIAFVYLVRQLQQWGYQLIDCQVYTAHLARFGALEVPRANFVQHLRAALIDLDHRNHAWDFDLPHGVDSLLAR